MVKRHNTREGMYDPRFEHDACGVGLLVNVKGIKSHRLVEQGLQVLEHMVHRGAEGADPKTGDGAGIMVQIPHEFILLQGVPVPEKGRYGTGLVFMPRDAEQQQIILDIMEREALRFGMKLMAVRDMPVNNEMLGEVAREAEPAIKQIFVSDEETTDPIEIRLYLMRKSVERKVAESSEIEDKNDFYVVSLSSKIIVYKGMLSSLQLRYYYPDLMNPRFTTAMALVHSRFSTNTFPTWSLAQPFRILGHNGEINTIRGNRLWMKARESVLQTAAFRGYDVTPIIQPGMSDSASLDNVLEFFVMAGMSLPHALAMLVPESFNDRNPISTRLKAFYEYHSILMEAWDGPAALLFSDGRYAGGMLDRNGLRPARYLVTNNDTVVIASETGVLPFEPSEIRERGRLRPGKMMIVDMQEGLIMHDEEIKASLADEFPYRDWLGRYRINLDNITSGRKITNEVEDFSRLKRVFFYNKEEVEDIMMSMAIRAMEPVASMGKDSPMSVLSEYPKLLYSYFRQQFAQVTNPPIDPLREELVMSLDSYIGAVDMSLLDMSPELCKMVLLKRPIITNRELDLLCNLRYKGFITRKLDLTTTVNLYNNHISAWHYTVKAFSGNTVELSGDKQNSFAWDARMLVNLRLPWGLSFQATGRYSSEHKEAQGSHAGGWSVDAGLRKVAGNWSISLNCRDIFDSRRFKSTVNGIDYFQRNERWRAGRQLRLTIKYSFGNMKAKPNKNMAEPMGGSGYDGGGDE